MHFKATPLTLFRGADGGDLAPNVMRLRIDPAPGSATRFNVKRPGPQMHLAAIETGFCYGDFFDPAPTVGYESLIYDCMMGDPTLFQRADTIEASWAAVDPLLKAWKDAPVCFYPAGSPGPKEADDLLARDGRSWLPLGEK